MKNLLVAAVAALVLASPARAFDMDAWADEQRQQQIFQQQAQTLRDMQFQQQAIQQAQQAAQGQWGARCAARGYQGCY